MAGNNTKCFPYIEPSRALSRCAGALAGEKKGPVAPVIRLIVEEFELLVYI